MVELHDAAVLWDELPANKLILELLSVIFCVAVIAVELFKTRQSQSPAQSTRHSQSLQKRNVIIFGVLAVISVITIGQFKVLHLIHSYRQWFHRPHLRMGMKELPTGLPGRSYLPQVPAIFTMQYFESWTQTLYDDEDPIALLVEQSRNFWYTQQYYMGLMAWAVFVGTEARIRGLSLPAVFAFAWLGLTSLSFAQCLFYMFIILAPILPSRRLIWTPHIAFMLVPVAGASAAVSMLRKAADDGEWLHELTYLCALLPVLVAMSAVLLPKKVGTSHRTAQSLHKAQAQLFQGIASIALILHIIATVDALRDSIPVRRNTWLHAKKTPLERASVAARSLLWAPAEHASVSAIAWELILSTLAMCIWTFVGSVNARSMLRCTFMPWVGDADETATIRQGRGIRRGTKRKSSAPVDVDELDSVLGTRRTRSISRKSFSEPDAVYAATGRQSRTNSRAPTRTVSCKGPAESSGRERSRSASRQRRTIGGRARIANRDKDNDEDDNDYVPMSTAAKEQASVIAHPAISAVEDLAGPAEASALALGLCVLGGLGTAAAGVFGGEMA